MARRRRSSDSDSASSGGSSDTLVIMMIIALTGGFALLAFPDLLKNTGGTGGKGCADAAKKTAAKTYIANSIGTYIRNHLNKQITLSAAQVAQKILTGYPSGITAMATQSGCITTPVKVDGFFYKTYATIALRMAPQLGTGVNLSSGALAAMKAMEKDGVHTHLSALAMSYPGMTQFELQRLAQDYGYGYSQVMSEYGRSFVGVAEEEDIVKKVSNVEDYETIGKSL